MHGCRDVRVQVFQHLDATDLLQHLKGNPQLGTQVSPLTALWGAYIASFVLKLASADAFIRRMENKSEVH